MDRGISRAGLPRRTIEKLTVVLFLFSFTGYIFLAYGVPAITYVSPTLSGNATTNLNWTYINITSTEDLNQSLLEWGNQSGFTNVTMTNSSLANWFVNMTNLTDGTYNYTIWMENTTGNWNQSTRKWVTVDTVAPYNLSACQDLTIENGSYILVQNVSSQGTCFTIKANNITLDGAGYTINYSQSATGYGVNNSGGYNRIIINNISLVQENASVWYAYAIYDSGTIYTTISNNTISTSGNAAYGIYHFESNSTTFFNNNITTSGNSSYGLYIGTSSDSNTLSSNTIKTSGTNSWGIFVTLSTNSSITGNVLNTTNAYAIYVNPTTTSSYYNHTIDTTNTEQGEPIYYYFANSSMVIENLANVGQLYVANSTNITIRNITFDKDGLVFAMVRNSIITNVSVNTSETRGISLYSSNANMFWENNITTSGDSKEGVFLQASTSNTFLSNRIVTSGSVSPGITIFSSSDSNNLTNNIISSVLSYGIYLMVSSANSISGGSVFSQSTHDYYLANGGASNNFTSTNFTSLRKIYFADTTSYFNYNNDSSKNIWLKTNVSAQSYLTRTLVNWTNITMQWNDTNSTAGVIANYNLAGLMPNATYAIYNTSGNISTKSYALTTNESGNLPAFTITLRDNTEIKVTDGPPIISVVSPLNQSYGANQIWANVTLSEAGSWCGVSLNGTANQTMTPRATNITWYANLSSLPEGLKNITFYCNDTRGNMGNSSITYFTIDTIIPTFTSRTAIEDTSTSEIINWATNEATNATIYYWRSGGAVSSYSVPEYVSSHGKILTSLLASTLYYYNITVCDYARNCNTSVQDSFTTAAADSSDDSESNTNTNNNVNAPTDGLSKTWSSISANTLETMVVSSSTVDVSQITLKLTQAAANVKLTVAKLSSKPSSISPDPSSKVYQYVEIKPENITESKISSATISFKVSTSWLTQNGADASSIVLYRYSGGQWNALSTYPAEGSTTQYKKFLAMTPGFSYFAIAVQATSATARAPANTSQTTANITQNSSAQTTNSTGNGTVTGLSSSKSSGTVSKTIIILLILATLIGGGVFYYRKSDGGVPQYSFKFSDKKTGDLVYKRPEKEQKMKYSYKPK